MFQKKNKEEIRRINDELSRVDASAGRLKDIEMDIKKVVNVCNLFLGFNRTDIRFTTPKE